MLLVGAPRTRLLRKRKAASKGWNREISKWNKDSVGKHQSYAQAKNATTFFTGLKTCVRLNAKGRVQFIQEISRQHSIPAVVISAFHLDLQGEKANNGAEIHEKRAASQGCIEFKAGERGVERKQL